VHRLGDADLVGPALNPYRMLAEGRWGPAAIRVERRGRHQLPAELLPAVECAWQAACARPGVHLFDGALLRLDAWQVADGMLHLALGETGYKDFLGSNAAHPEWLDRHGAHALATPLGTSAALLTGDRRLVFGMRSQAVALYPGHAHPFGGTMDPVPRPDVFREVLRELEEEVALTPADIAGTEAVALIEDCALHQIELVFLVRCRLDQAGLAARLDRAEHTALWSVAADAAGLDRTLDDRQAMTAVTRATLVAAGRILAGDAWATHRLAADLARGARR
jgi:hypothetical protein